MYARRGVVDACFQFLWVGAKSGMDYWNGILDYWNGILDWITGLSYFSLWTSFCVYF